MLLLKIRYKRMLTAPLYAIVMLSALIAGPSCDRTDDDNLLTQGDRRQMLRMVNEVRSKGRNCGDTWFAPAGELTWNDLLEKAAEDKSKEMYDLNYFSHSSPDGKNVGDRLEFHGYAWQACGENLARGASTVEEAMKGWLESPGHCANIMNPDYQEFGAAQYGIYWTQVFAKK